MVSLEHSIMVYLKVGESQRNKKMNRVLQDRVKYSDLLQASQMMLSYSKQPQAEVHMVVGKLSSATH